jgi:CO/xanthine dehydrogenase FAD-binding subunit
MITPLTLSEALEAHAEHPRAVPIHGGTDIMVDVNFGRRAPGTLLDLSRVTELAGWSCHGTLLRIGAGVTYAELAAPPFDTLVPALAQAARTVGSPQIRNRATIGGNLATASPAGDGLPPLIAQRAEVEVASVRGTRRMPVARFIVGPKQTALACDELITSVTLAVTSGPQTFMKVGPRNAMVISVASLALVVDEAREEVRAAYGSAGPVVGLECRARGRAGELPEAVASECRPIDDVRGTADYRRHALRILTERALARCLA